MSSSSALVGFDSDGTSSNAGTTLEVGFDASAPADFDIGEIESLPPDEDVAVEEVLDEPAVDAPVDESDFDVSAGADLDIGEIESLRVAASVDDFSSSTTAGFDASAGARVSSGETTPRSVADGGAGAIGADGSTGVDGVDGSTGADGTDGTDGSRGGSTTPFAVTIAITSFGTGLDWSP